MRAHLVVLVLAAATRVSADQDTVNFRSSGRDELTDDVLALHKAAVESAQSGRVSLLNVFRGLIGGG